MTMTQEKQPTPLNTIIRLRYGTIRNLAELILANRAEIEAAGGEPISESAIRALAEGRTRSPRRETMIAISIATKTPIWDITEFRQAITDAIGYKPSPEELQQYLDSKE